MQLKNWLFPNNNNFLLSKTPTCLSWCFAFIFITQINYSQINLVQNPSFEDTLTCPFGGGQIKYALGWDTLIAGGGGTPDLLSRCSPFTVSVPLSNFGFQYPMSGNNYSGIGLYVSGSSFSREYLQGNLIKKLDSSKNYCISLYVNLANIATAAIDRVGAYLDNGSINSQYFQATINYTPQIQSLTGQYLTDTLNWTKIQGTYTADGTEQHITLGNFHSDAQTNTISISAGFVAAYYFIDNVSVIEADTKAYAGNDNLICVGDSVFIGRQPEVGLECEWFSNNTTIAQGAGLWVKPTTTQQYIIKQDVCGVLSYDTVKVTIDDCELPPDIIKEFTIPNVLTPNSDGINDTWQFSLPIGVTLSGVEVYNRWGNVMYQSTLTNRQSTILWDGRTTSGEPCSDGVYFYVLKLTDANKDMQIKKGYITVFR